MKEIEIKQEFKWGRDLYRAGERRIAEDADAAVFIREGWAASAGDEAAAVSTAPVTLDVHSATHQVEDSNG